MRDPHVQSLHYRLVTSDTITFDNPSPLADEVQAFRLRLEDGLLTVEMKDHCPTPEMAREAVEAFLRSWGLQTALDWGEELCFEFDCADVIDRDPPSPGSVCVGVGALELEWAVMEARGVVTWPRYPPLPVQFKATPDVATMWFRYKLYLGGREPLLSMAYFCLSLLEGTTGVKQGARRKVCEVYRVEQDVRDRLGDIVSERGSPEEARKLDHQATRAPLTDREKQWVEDVVKALIRRKGEYDADPAAGPALPLITMGKFVGL